MLKDFKPIRPKLPASQVSIGHKSHMKAMFFQPYTTGGTYME